MVKLLDQEVYIDKQCLFDILLSLPQQHGYVDWGHDYGGLLCAQRDDRLLLPGEGLILGGLDYDNMIQASIGSSIYSFDPLVVPKLLEMRTSRLISPNNGDIARSFIVR